MLRTLVAIVLCLAISSVVQAAPVVEDVSAPSSADASRPIPVYVNITSDVYVYEVLIRYQRPEANIPSYEGLYLLAGNHTNGTWAGEIEEQIWNGSLSCRIYVNEGQTVFPDQGWFVIFLEGKRESTFPWNLVLIAGFVVVVLILTELAFKPGLYRKTGRQRAMELEEEDRKKREEEQETFNQEPRPPGQGSGS